MNKPAFKQILEHSGNKPVLIFVSSRRQTRLTARDLALLAQTSDPPVAFLDPQMNYARFEKTVLNSIQDSDLRDAMRCGIGMHHAGLTARDRELCENAFRTGAIRVLIATATLAWGVNLPARLVILKGTEFFDGKVRRYVDMPITDVLQMIGRAGRPQFDTEAVACVFVHQEKKQFYRRFL